MLFLFVACCVLIVWHYWKRYSTILQLPCYLGFSFEVFHWALLPKRPGSETFWRYIFLKVLSLCKKYESSGMFVLWPLVSSPWLVVYGEESLKFFSTEATLISKPYMYEFFYHPDSKLSSLFQSSGQKWKKERRLVAPAFRTSVVKEMVSAMNHHTAALVSDLSRSKGETIDISDMIKANAIRLFHESAMGLELDTEASNEKVRKWIEITERVAELGAYRMVRPWLHYDFMWRMSSFSKEQAKLCEDLKCLIMDTVSQLKERMKQQNCRRNVHEVDEETFSRKCTTFSECLMEMHLQDPSFTMDDVIGQIFTIIFGGFDTSSSTLVRTLWLLGLHPDVQEKAYDEITSTTDQSVTFEDARELSFLECVIKESLRLYPVGPIYARRSDREIQFGKYRIPENTTVALVPYILHRNPKVYPDPEAFNPERFRSEDSSKSPWTLFPFAEGMRSCIGKNYAMLQMKILLSHVLRNFKIVSLDRREDVPVSWEIFLKTMVPLRMKFVPR